MADIATRQTDDRMKRLMKRLEGVYNDAYKAAVENEKKAITKYASLTDEALADLTPEARQLKREAFAAEIRRIEGIKNSIAKEIAQAGQTAEQIIRGEMAGIYGLNYDFSTYTIQRQANIALSFTQYDRNQIAAIVNGEKLPFEMVGYAEQYDRRKRKYILDKAFGRLGDDKVIVARLQNELIKATLLGESQAKIMRRIKGVANMSTRQAKRIAQTERTRVQSQGRQLGIDEANNIGVECDREWSARMVNTREAHMHLDGKIAKHDEPFISDLGEIMFPGDPGAEAANVINCFCIMIPRVVSTSPALASHREKFGNVSFEDYRESLQSKEIIDDATGIRDIRQGEERVEYDWFSDDNLKHAIEWLGVPEGETPETWALKQFTSTNTKLPEYVEENLTKYLNSKPIEDISLYRLEGMWEGRQNLSVGDTYSSDLRSYSDKSGFPKYYLENYGISRLGETPVLIEVAGGTRSIDISEFSPYPEQHERLSSGRFEVIEIKDIKIDEYDIIKILVRQLR